MQLVISNSKKEKYVETEPESKWFRFSSGMYGMTRGRD